MKKITVLLVLFFVVLVSANGVWAAGFNLKSIGELSVDGLMLSKWWYSGLQPTFRGEASPGSVITVTIDETALEIAADSSGDWVFTPVSVLSVGEHSMNFKNEAGEISFVLVLGSENVDWDAVESGGGEVLPTVGFLFPTLLSLGLGVGMVWVGRRKIGGW